MRISHTSDASHAPGQRYWYDYTGFPKEARADYYKKIRTIAKKYHASLLDYSDQEYTKYFFEDGVHIGKKGWAVINEDLYHFYQDMKRINTFGLRLGHHLLLYDLAIYLYLMYANLSTAPKFVYNMF